MSWFQKHFSLWWLGFILILGVGFFMRTYHLEETLRWNDDQGRDATLAQQVATGEREQSTLGPNVSGTRFKLGPMYYSLQTMSVGLFGLSPVSLAYPDVFFSLLTLPLFFLFLRKYFERREALALLAIFSMSFFVVEYARFAWNPNSLPFFSLLCLYAMLEMVRTRGLFWAVIAGVALGVGVQLHTLFLIIVSIVMGIFLGEAWWRGRVRGLAVGVMIVTALACNAVQISHEVRTGGENIQAFYAGVFASEAGTQTWSHGVFDTVMCQARQGVFILSAWGEVRDSFSDCAWRGWYRQWAVSASGFERLGLIVGLGASLIFVWGGYGWLVYELRRETDEERRDFLRLIALYGGVATLVLIGVAMTKLTARYFLILEWMPFVWLGLWWRQIRMDFVRVRYMLVWGSALILIVCNVWANIRVWREYMGEGERGLALVESITLRDQRFLATTIARWANEKQDIILLDKSGDLLGLEKGLQYLMGRNIKSVKEEKLQRVSEVALLIVVENAHISREAVQMQANSLGYGVKDCASNGRLMVCLWAR